MVPCGQAWNVALTLRWRAALRRCGEFMPRARAPTERRPPWPHSFLSFNQTACSDTTLARMSRIIGPRITQITRIASENHQPFEAVKACLQMKQRSARHGARCSATARETLEWRVPAARTSCRGDGASPSSAVICKQALSIPSASSVVKPPWDPALAALRRMQRRS